MPFIGTALQHRVGDESAALAVFGRVAVGDDAIFLNGVRRDGGRSAAFVVRGKLTAPGLALFVVVSAFYQVAAGAAARSVDFGTAVIGGSVLRNSSGNQLNKRVLIAYFQ